MAASLAALLAFAGCAQPPPPVVAPSPAAAAPVLQDEAAAALRRAAAAIGGASAFAVRVSTLREVPLDDGQRVLLAATASVLVRRPDHMTALVGSDAGNFGLWYDGRQLTLLNPTENVYGRTAVTGDVLSVIDWLEDRMGLTLPIRPIFAADPYAAMTEAGATSGRSLGPTLVGDTPVEHLALRNPQADWEIWLEATPRALPRRVSLVERTPQGPLRTTVEFEDWNLAPRLAGNAFTFVPPRGAVAATLLPLPDRAATGGTPR
jgi:hypothetical protein